MNAGLEKHLSPIEEIIDDARNGRMVIIVDDEGRENEGDLVIPAQMATPSTINFMAKFGRGLICLALTREHPRHLSRLRPPQPLAGLHHPFCRQGATKGRFGQRQRAQPRHACPLESRLAGCVQVEPEGHGGNQ